MMLVTLSAVSVLLAPTAAAVDYDSRFGSVAKLLGSWANFANNANGSTYRIVGNTIVLENKGNDVADWFAPGQLEVNDLRYGSSRVSMTGTIYHEYMGTCHRYFGTGAIERTVLVPNCVITVAEYADGTATFQSDYTEAKGRR